MREVISWQPQFVSERRRGGGGPHNGISDGMWSSPPSCSPPFLFFPPYSPPFCFCKLTKIRGFSQITFADYFCKIFCPETGKNCITKLTSKCNRYFAKKIHSSFLAVPYSASSSTQLFCSKVTKNKTKMVVSVLINHGTSAMSFLHPAADLQYLHRYVLESNIQ